MVFKISKSCVTALSLLLAVNFNTSYSMDNNIMQNNNDFPIDAINDLVGQYNNTCIYRQNVFTQIINDMNLLQQMQVQYQIRNGFMNLHQQMQAQYQIMQAQYQIQNDFYYLWDLNRQFIWINVDLILNIGKLYKNLFGSNYDNISAVFSAWNIDQLNNLNNVLNLPQVKQYISIERIKNRLQNRINGTTYNLINRINQNEINQNQLRHLINNMFSPYLARVNEACRKINSEFEIVDGNNTAQRTNVTNRIKNTLTQLFARRRNYLLNMKTLTNNYYNNIINNGIYYVNNNNNNIINQNHNINNNNDNNVLHPNHNINNNNNIINQNVNNNNIIINQNQNVNNNNIINQNHNINNNNNNNVLH